MKMKAKRQKWILLFAPALLLFTLGAGGSVLFTPHEEGRPVLIISHRGANWLAPQNTLPALLKAEDLKADFVEVDVRTTKDNKLVIMHNSDVDQTTNGKGKIRDMTLEEIKKLDAGVHSLPKFRGTQVPTFEEDLDAAKGRINIYLDWKDAEPKAIIDALEKADMLDNTVVYGGPAELLALQRLNKNIHPMPQVDTEQQLDEILKSGLKLDVIAASVPKFDEKIARKAHEHGLKVFVDILGPADSCDGLKKTMEQGADGVQTDRPDMIMKCLKKMNK